MGCFVYSIPNKENGGDVRPRILNLRSP